MYTLPGIDGCIFGIYDCMYVRMCVAHVFLCIYTPIRTYIHTHTQAFIAFLIDDNRQSDALRFVHTYIHTYTYTYTGIYSLPHR